MQDGWATRRLLNVLLEEIKQKHLCDPFAKDINPDYHFEVTITANEIRAAAKEIYPHVRFAYEVE